MPADDRVLLLDMRAAERGRLAASISRLGYVAILAEDVAAAQAIWEHETFPIVIVDMRDHHAQITELRAQMPGSAIIAIGARSLAAALEAWHAGADGYLPRPVRQNELANVLEHVLRIRAARAAELAEAQPERSALTEFRRMAAELARQINTPLTPILGMVDLLAEELPPDHPGHEYTQAITTAALRIRDVAWMLADIAQQSG
jgi:two-component system response regulator AlgR